MNKREPRNEREARMQSLFKRLGIGFYELRVYGSRGCMICGARDTAEKAMMVLAQATFSVKVMDSVREVKDESRIHGIRLEKCFAVHFNV